MSKQIMDKYANAQTTMCGECKSKNVVAIEFSSRLEHGPSTSRTFVRLFVMEKTKQATSQ